VSSISQLLHVSAAQLPQLVVHDSRVDATSEKPSGSAPKTVETQIRGAFAELGIKEAPEDNRPGGPE
jgi:hypothetical protein